MTAAATTREVVKCSCGLVQYATPLCRRCKQPFVEPETPPEPEPPAPKERSFLDVTDTIRELRRYRGWTQRKLAAKMGVPRTYIVKVETGRCTPGIAQLFRFAEVLRVPSPAVFFDADRRNAFLASEMLADPLMGEIAALLPRLTAKQRAEILSRLSAASAPRAAR